MRWSYLLPRAVLILLFWSFFTFAFDPLLQRGMIAAGQQAVSARVDVAEFKTSFLPPAVEVKNVRIANRNEPGTNLIEFADLNGRLAIGPLLKRSYIIEKGELSGLAWGTPRKDSGLLPGMSAPEPEPDANPLSEQLSKIGKQFGAELLERAKLEADPRQFESVRLSEDAKDRWQSNFKRLEDRVELLKARIDTIERAVKSKEKDPLAKIEAYARAAEDVKRVLAEARQIRSDLEKMPNRARSDMEAINAAKERDLQKIREKVAALRMNAEELSEFLLGPEIFHHVAEALEWLSWAKQRVGVARYQPEPERMRGQDFVFPRKEELPDFLVRLLTVSGQGDLAGENLAFNGTITGITSDPVVHGKPTVIRIKAGGEADIQLKAVLDYTRETPVNELVLTYSAARKNQLRLGDPDNLAVAVSADKTDWRVELLNTGEALDGRLMFRQQPVSLVPILKDGFDERLQAILGEVLTTIQELRAGVVISGSVDHPKWKLDSNLGNEIVRGLDDVVGRQIETNRQKLAAQMDATLERKSAELVQLFNGKYSGLLANLKLNEDHVQRIVPKVADRPLNLKKLFRR